VRERQRGSMGSNRETTWHASGKAATQNMEKNSFKK